MDVRHVPFGLILGEDGRKMSSRDGGTPLLSDLLDQARQAAVRHTMARDAALVAAAAAARARESGEDDGRGM